MTLQTPAQSNRPVVTIKLASTSDERLQCYALRAALLMAGQQCPYWEECDVNNYTASHLMRYVDGDPAASMRVRWFSGFAKLERAIIRKRYRSMGLFAPFVEWAKFAAQKGYPKAYLHGQKRLWKVFERQGFRKVNDRPFHFSDHEYGGFAAEVDVAEDAPSVLTDPMVLNRPEDQLVRRGILEESMERGASNPHAEWTERRMN